MSKPKLEMNNLNLRAIDQIWQLEYIQTADQSLRLLVSPGGQRAIKLYGATHDLAALKKLLERWLKQQAEQHLFPWLQRLSVQHKLGFNRVILRGQRTIWGSCSHDKSISLNYKLLFLPPEYAQHVMLHELCHTKHLNHSQRFWNLLQKLDPHTPEYRKILIRADSFVPEIFNKALIKEKQNAKSWV